ncbi:MAG: tetratricopeptide repeat protein [Bacillota bacterium]
MLPSVTFGSVRRAKLRQEGIKEGDGNQKVLSTEVAAETEEYPEAREQVKPTAGFEEEKPVDKEAGAALKPEVKGAEDPDPAVQSKAKTQPEADTKVKVKAEAEPEMKAGKYPAPGDDAGETAGETKKAQVRIRGRRGMLLTEAFHEAVSLHERGVTGDKEAVKNAYDLLKKILKAAPRNSVVEAYFGSATALLGRDALDPNERFKKAVKGLRILDGAVSNAPDNTEVRTLRAYVCYRLPENYFHRTATAVEDFGYLAARYEKDPSVFSGNFYCQVLYDLGASYKRLGRKEEAESTWQKLLSRTKDAKYRQLLKQEGIKVPELTEEENISQNVPVTEVDLQTNKKKDELFGKGLKLRSVALSGDKEAVRGALDHFTKALDLEPDNPLIKAYHADCTSLEARHAGDPGKMFAGAIKAMKTLDAVVNSNPDDVEVRFIRAYHGFRLPEAFFHRTAAAIADFEYLIRHWEKDHSVFSKESYQRLLFDLGVAHRRLGMEEEAAADWKKLLSLRPAPKYKAMIEEHRGFNLVRNSMKKLSLEGDKEAYYKEGIRLHDLGVAGNREAAKLALDMWEKAYEKNQGDTLARAYYGSSMALVARDGTDPNTLFGSAIKGMVHVNRALSRDRDNPAIRLLRAYLTNSLPEAFFHQTHKAIKDFRYLAMAYQKDNTIFSKEQYHKILYDLGSAYERVEDREKAKKVWANLLADDPDPKYAVALRGKVEAKDDES